VRQRAPSCDKCKMPRLLPENLDVYSMARESMLGSFDGMSGGLRFEGIREVLLSHGLSIGSTEYREHFTAVVHYLTAWTSAKRAGSGR